MTGPAGTQTAQSQSAHSPEQIIQLLKAGNDRFVQGQSTQRDHLAQAKETEAGQYPHTIVLGCIDSRVPVETIFDQGIGDMFVARVAGNIATTEVLGSMEFATAAAGAKAIVVLGHTHCGAIKGAIDEVKLGNLTTLLAGIEPAVSATPLKSGEKNSQNSEYVNDVTHTNVRLTLQTILKESPTIAKAVEKGDVTLAGAVYDLGTGKVNFLD